MERKELKEAIIAAIVEENGALTVEELDERIFGRKSCDNQIDICSIIRSYGNNKIFRRIGRGVGYTLTDQKWDEIEKERRNVANNKSI